MKFREEVDARQKPDVVSDAEPDDSFLEYLNIEYRHYRTATWVLGIIGLSLMLVSVALAQANVLQIKVFNLFMSIANLFIVLMLVLAFTRTRPYRKRIREYDKSYVSVIDPDAPDGVRIEQRELPDMDDFYKIFERGVRTELVPQTDEYTKLRRTWVTTYVIAAALAIVAIAVYFLAPEAALVQTSLMIAAFALVGLAFYMDRTKMKPLRDKWAREVYGMGEFRVRDNMRYMKDEKR